MTPTVKPRQKFLKPILITNSQRNTINVRDSLYREIRLSNRGPIRWYVGSCTARSLLHITIPAGCIEHAFCLMWLYWLYMFFYCCYKWFYWFYTFPHKSVIHHIVEPAKCTRNSCFYKETCKTSNTSGKTSRETCKTSKTSRTK